MDQYLIIDTKFLAYSYFENQPNLSVYDTSQVVDASATNTVEYSATENTMKIYLADTNGLAANGKIRLMGKGFNSAVAESNINGREFTISSVSDNSFIQINTQGLGFPDTDFNIQTGKTGDVDSDGNAYSIKCPFIAINPS